jgi:hypothetical protein
VPDDQFGVGGNEPDADTVPEVVDVFDGLVLDDDFVRGGVYEPPARTREAIARHGNDRTSWRHGGGLHQPPVPAKKLANPPARPPRRVTKRRDRLIASLPAIVAVLVVALVVAFGSHLSL